MQIHKFETFLRFNDFRARQVGFTMANEGDGDNARSSDRASESRSEQSESRQNFSNEAVQSDRDNGSNVDARNEQSKMDSQQMANDGTVGNLTLTDDQAERSVKGKSKESGKDAGKDTASKDAVESPQQLGKRINEELGDRDMQGSVSNDTMRKVGKAAEQAYQKDGEAGMKKLGNDISNEIKKQGGNSSIELPNKKDIVGKDFHEFQINHASGKKSNAALPWDQPKKQ